MDVYTVLLAALAGWRHTHRGVTDTWVRPVPGREWTVRLNLVLDAVEVIAPDGCREATLFEPSRAEILSALADRGVPVPVMVRVS